ncbi:MAG: tetratricopeptide repeat protein [Deltaproteobacteria bacterium]|nr:tetratricopeptide repeat protein [Deltaproteobacteria bacterium]
MPQADSSEIPYNTSDRTNFPAPSPRTILVGTSTAGRKFLYFWVVVALVLGIVTVILFKNKADGQKGFVFKTKPSAQSPTGIRSKTAWQNSYSSGLALAKQEGKMQMLYFYTDWCGWCKKMEKESFSDKGLNGLLDQFIKVKIDGDKEKQTTQKYGITGYPTLVFTDSEGEVIEKMVGFLPANTLEQKIRTLLARNEKLPKEGNSQGIAEPSQEDQVDVKEEQEISETDQEKGALAEVAQPPPDKDENPSRYHEQAHSYEKQGDLEKASEFFRKAIELAPDNWKHRRCFSGLLTRMGDFTEAARQLERASELNPADPEIFHQLGHAFWKVKEYHRSISAFDRAIELAQNNKQVSACAAKAYYELGLMESDTKRSEVYLRMALNLINKVAYGANTTEHVRDLKFQINRAYGRVVKNNLPGE